MVITSQIYIHELQEYGQCAYECPGKRRLLSCHHCEKSVCLQRTCSHVFPHHKNTVLVICRSCQETMEKKFVLCCE